MRRKSGIPRGGKRIDRSMCASRIKFDRNPSKGESRQHSPLLEFLREEKDNGILKASAKFEQRYGYFVERSIGDGPGGGRFGVSRLQVDLIHKKGDAREPGGKEKKLRRRGRRHSQAGSEKR